MLCYNFIGIIVSVDTLKCPHAFIGTACECGDFTEKICEVSAVMCYNCSRIEKENYKKFPDTSRSFSCYVENIT